MTTKRAFTIWFTGLPASGKTPLAYAVGDRLRAHGWPIEVINSGKLRRSPLGAALGFSKADRDLNVQRHGLAAGLLARNGVIALVTAVSPYRAARDKIRQQLQDFFEIYVSTPPAICVERDVTGLWKQALAGDLRNFTGVDGPYEPPENPEFVADLSDGEIYRPADAIVQTLIERGFLERAPTTENQDLEARLAALGYTT